MLLDALRGLAIVCMLIAHAVPFFYPTGIPDPMGVVTRGINNVASPLFGLAIGGAAALVWARPALAMQWPRRILTDVARGVVVFAIGMLVVELNTWVAIVLHVLGVLMIIGIPIAALAGLSSRRGRAGQPLWWGLVGVTVALFALAPWLTGAVVPAGERLANGTTGGWLEVWAALMAGTSYRAVSLVPFFALGAVIASAGIFAEPRQLARYAGPAAVVFLLVLVASGGLGRTDLSGDYADQFGDLTLVTLAMAAMSVLVGWGSRVRALTGTLAALGAIALSVYALQLIVLKPLMSWSAWMTSALWGWVALLTLVILPSVIMIAWRRFLGAGPLEQVVALVTGKGRAT